MSVPLIRQALLPPNTIVPIDEDLYIPYFNRLYEEIAFAVNSKNNSFFQFAIQSVATSIPNVNTFGAFLVCVSGTNTNLPTITASLCKSSATAAGSVAVLGSQAGTGAWAGFNLTITSTTTNFQIAHNNTGISGNFNIIIMGTQGY